MMGTRSRCWMLAFCLLPIAWGGCQYENVEKTPRRSAVSAADPVADRLHDISGSLLLFYSAYHRMPDSMKELCAATGLHPAQILDPQTQQPFVYYAEGRKIQLGDGEKYLVLSAATGPAAQMQWVIVAEQLNPQAIAAAVVALPQSVIQAPTSAPATQPSSAS